MLRGLFDNLIFTIIARMLCGNHLKHYNLKHEESDARASITKPRTTIFRRHSWLLTQLNFIWPHDNDDDDEGNDLGSGDDDDHNNK